MGVAAFGVARSITAAPRPEGGEDCEAKQAKCSHGADRISGVRRRRVVSSYDCGNTDVRNGDCREYHGAVEDDDIRDGLRAGDLERAFRTLRERYGRAVYRGCLFVLRDPVAAEDAQQETFVKAFKKRQQLAEAESLVGYLMQMAKHTAIDVQRRDARRRRIDRERNGGEPAAVVAVGDGGEADADPAEAQALRECLDELDPTTRQGVVMWHYDELPWQVIAEAVDLPIDTIRMRVTRALAGLRRCIEKKKVGRS